MSDIPEDVMQAAGDVVVRVFSDETTRTDEEGNAVYSASACQKIIARAILAERERCARMVLEWQNVLVPGERIAWHAERIATAIRSGVEDGRG